MLKLQASRQLLALPSQQQQQQLVQDRLQSLSMSMSADSAPAPSKCLLPKPLDDERRVCAYAFDVSNLLYLCHCFSTQIRPVHLHITVLYCRP